MTRIFTLVALLFALGGISGASAQKGEMQLHLVIADPATLSGERAEDVYQSIRGVLGRRYLESGDPVAGAYQSWKRYNVWPYRSSPHGELFVNNYANSTASRYGLFESLGRLPEGAIVIKDSFMVTEHGEVMTGPLFLMEKRGKGFNTASNDWLFMTIRANGTISGITKGEGAENVEFCVACHNKAPRGQDNLFLLPEGARQRN
jgi:hypothetical protein